MAAQAQQWTIREGKEDKDLAEMYGNFNTFYTSLKIIHGGKFTPTPGRQYVRSKETYVDSVEVHKLSYELLSDIIKALNYTGKAYFYRIEEAFGLELGLINLEIKSDFEKFFDFLFPLKCTQVHTIYVEHDRKSQIACFPNSLRKAAPHVMEKLLFDFVVENPDATINNAKEYLFKEYGVLVAPFYLTPGLQRVKRLLSAINGDD